MTSFVVDQDRLADLVQHISRVTADLVELEADVAARVARLHAGWHGEAATLHTGAHRHWTEGAREVRGALTTLRTIAQTADENYAAAARTNLGMWGS